MRKRETKSRVLIIFSAIIMLIALLAEFYTMINYPQYYVVIAGGAVIIVLFLYLIIQGVMNLRTIKDERREEQYESIFKSEKASYLMLKKYFEQLDEKIDTLQESSKIPTDEIVNTQKGVAKVIINRNKENAEALMGSNDQLIEKFDEFKENLDNNNDVLLTGQKTILSDSLGALISKQQELAESMKEMEIRLNQAIMQTQEAISSRPIQLTANVEIPTGTIPTGVAPAMTVEPATLVQPEKLVEEPVVETVEETPAEPMVENVAEENAEAVPEREQEIPAAEPVVEAPVENEVEEAPVTEQPVEAVVEAAPVEAVAETPAEPVLEPTGDPNRQLSPDEIAAMFTSAAGDAPAEESKVEEPVTEAVVETTAAEPVIEPAGDPNRQLSPDEIAAMFASAAGETPAEEKKAEETPTAAPEQPAEPETPVEPAAEEKPAMPDLSDPNRKLSPDEIAALIASM